MKRTIIGAAVVMLQLPLLLLACAAIALVGAPAASAQPCGGAIVFGNGGSQCDGPVQADGSFQRCTSVYVLGIGGWSCYTVYPPPPQ